MPAQYETDALIAIQALLDKVTNVDPAPLLRQLEYVLAYDNQQGVLHGLDGRGEPMQPTVREGSEALKIKKGFGPPLAPQNSYSRVIRNYRTAWYQRSHSLHESQWVVFGAWENVLSKNGVPFLPFHFRGEGNLPVRNLAGLRPAGWNAAVDACGAYAAQFFGGTP